MIGASGTPRNSMLHFAWGSFENYYGETLKALSLFKFLSFNEFGSVLQFFDVAGSCGPGRSDSPIHLSI